MDSRLSIIQCNTSNITSNQLPEAEAEHRQRRYPGPGQLPHYIPRPSNSRLLLLNTSTAVFYL